MLNVLLHWILKFYGEKNKNSIFVCLNSDKFAFKKCISSGCLYLFFFEIYFFCSQKKNKKELAQQSLKVFLKVFFRSYQCAGWSETDLNFDVLTIKLRCWWENLCMWMYVECVCGARERVFNIYFLFKPIHWSVDERVDYVGMNVLSIAHIVIEWV